MKKIQHKTYSISEAARIWGVTEKQIRHWEKMGHMPSPQRVICGKRSYRQFGDGEIKQIRKIKKYLDEGFTLASAAKNGCLYIKCQGGFGKCPIVMSRFVRW